MATSPNYAWAEPDNSSLVKNGAADIRTLGDAIDTSVWNIGFGQAGKNKIINGNMAINQRSFTSSTTSSDFGFDRWQFVYATGTVTYSAQTFTPGAAPVAGYEGTNFARIATTGQSASNAQSRFQQKIEDVRTFAGQTVTLSFWAKANTGTPKVFGYFGQSFGSGGSAFVDIYASAVTISTSWARYSITVAIPSISGKTVGTGSSLFMVLWTSAGSGIATIGSAIGIQNAEIDFWGVQVEYGSKATPFQLAGGGDPQSELAMCQRYYYRQTVSTVYGQYCIAWLSTATGPVGLVTFPVTMRVAPTALESSNLSFRDYANTHFAASSVTLDTPTTTSVGAFYATITGGTAGRVGVFEANNTTSSYLGWTAEL